MAVGYKLLLFCLLICGVIMIINGTKKCNDCVIQDCPKTQPNNKKEETKEVKASDVFNDLSQPTPWIHGHIERSSTKHENHRHLINHEGV
jgi:hypothetical protein